MNDGTLWFDFGDVNGDGRLDCATAQGESSFLDRLYLGTATAPVDVRAPSFRSVEAVSDTVSATATPIVRFGVVDNATTDEGPRLKSAWIRVTLPSGTTDVPAKFSGGDLYRAVLPAQSQPGLTVSYQACAKDRQGNEACSPAKTYAVEGSATSSSSVTGGATSSSGATGSSSASGGVGGAGGNGGVGGGSSASGSSSAGDTSSATSTGTRGEGGSGGAGGGSGEDSGCGCAVPGGAPASGLGALAALGFAALAQARRRRR